MVEMEGEGFGGGFGLLRRWLRDSGAGATLKIGCGERLMEHEWQIGEFNGGTRDREGPYE